MNKIYKVIWSKVKNCYIVASELAKNHTKSPKSGVVGQKLENDIMLSLCNSAVCVPDFSTGVIAPVAMNFVESVNVKVDKSFKITVAAIVKNEAENVPTWVQAARSCADEIVVVDTGSTDGTVERFADYGIKCFHYDWNDDFASAKNYMISLCHGDWIVLLDGDEWFREGCDVRKAIAKHHGNPITKAIIADWICLDKDRNNTVMFSGGAVRAFRNQPDVRYFRKVHENLTINYENFVFEPDFKMYHTGYSGSVNRSKHERNLRIMRTMFDFDNGKVEYPTDWRYIEDTYAGLGQFDKALWAADKMISYGIQEYSAAAWITKFNVLFAMKTPMNEMKKQFAYCFKTVPSVSGFRFLASIYYARNGRADLALDEYIEGVRMLMGPQDKVAMEHTFWRMYLPEASALASTVYLQNKQVEAALYACKVCEQYCGQTDWTNRVLADVRRIMNLAEESLLGNISERVLPVLQFGKKAVLATALTSSLTIGMVGVANSVYAAGCVIGGSGGCASGTSATVIGGLCNKASGKESSVAGGQCNIASALQSFAAGGCGNTASKGMASAFGGANNTASGTLSTTIGGLSNTASGGYGVTIGGSTNKAIGTTTVALGGSSSTAYALSSVAIGGGITGVSTCSNTAQYSIAIGKNAKTTEDYEVAIGSACAPVKIDGALTVDGAKTVSDGKNTKSWTELLSVGSPCFADGVVLAGCSNTASGCYSSVSGGCCNIASGEVSSVSGGYCNEASGTLSSVSGGRLNMASCDYSSVSGGSTNIASGCYSSVSGGYANEASGYYSSVSGGYGNTASGCSSSVIGGCNNKASGEASSVSGGDHNTASGVTSSVSGGYYNRATGENSSVSGGSANQASGNQSYVGGGSAGKAVGEWSAVVGGSSNEAHGEESLAIGGCCGMAYGHFSIAIGGGIAGVSSCATTAQHSIAIGSGAKTTKNYEIAIGSACAPVKIGGNLTVTGTQTVTDGTTSKTWADILSAGSYTLPAATSSTLGGVKIGSNITNTNGTISLTKANVTAALGYTPPTTDMDTHYTTHLYVGSGTAANAATTNGNTKIALADDSTVRNTLTIKGAGKTTVTSDANGVITITSTDANTTYSAFTGATSSVAGTAGLVKAPAAGDQNKFLRGDGTWAVDNDTKYSAATTSAAGLMSAADKAKLDGIASGANAYTLPAATSSALGGVKIGSNITNSNGTISLTKSNVISALGYTPPTVDTDTHYSTPYGISSTAAATAAKEVTVDDFSLDTGSVVTVKFSATNSVANPTLNVNGTGAKPIYYKGAAISKSYLAANKTYQFVYNGTQYELVGDVDTNTTYTNMSATELNAGTATSARSISAKVIADYVTDKVSAETTARNTAISSEATARADADTALNTRVDESIKGLSVSGKTITYTKGDGTTGTITTQDTNTTYAAGNGVALSGTTFSAKAGTNVSVDSNGINVVGNGSVASGNTGLVSGGTLFTENRITADGTFAKKANTTAANITALDTAAKNAIKGLSVSGKIITYTKGDGTTGTITTQDTNTTYSAFTGATSSAAGTAGLVKAPAAGDQNKFLRGDGTWAVDNDTKYTAMTASEATTGTGTTARSITAKVLADYVGGKVTDAKNGTITDLSVSGKTITYTKGDGTTGTITTQDTNTTYSAGAGLSLLGTTFSVNTNGSVASGNAGVLNGGTVYSEVRPIADGTFAKKANTTAANITALDTAAKNAIKDLSVSGKVITYTKGDGTTGTITTQDNNTTYSAFTGATSSAAGTAGLVKAPAAGDQNKFLRGDGTWAVDNDTKYSNMSASELSTGTATTARSISAKVVADYVTGKVSAETTARNTAISSEATARADADTALGTRIDGTIKDLSVSGRTITYTKGDGTTGTITTQDNNTTYANMTASELETGTATTARTISAKVVSDYVTGKVSAETTARTTAINSEATTRANADTALGTRIDNAITAYESADTGLSNRIGSLSADGNYIKKSATNNVSANLTALDTQLKTTTTAVSTETTNRTNADTALSNRIGSVASDGTFIKKSATNDVATNLTALDTAAKNAIKSLSVSGQTITYTKGDGTTGTITTQDKNTTYGAGTADNLTTGTDTTGKVWTSKVLADYVKGQVATETTNRTTAVSNEATTRSEADTALSNRIGSLTADGNYIKKSATNNVSANLTALDTQLKTTTTAVSTEATTRANADTALGTRIDNVTSAYQTADTTLSNRIGSLTADGTFIKKSATNDVAANLTALDTAAKNAIKGLSVSGTTITYTKGDGTIGTITTQDNNTTYDNMSSTELSAGTATTARSISAKVVADYVTGKVSAETTARTTAINSEASTRQSEDTALSNRIGSLSADGNYIKKSATNNVSANLTALDTQLKTTTTSVSTEATTRANADTSLGNRIGTLSADGNYIKKSAINNVSENLTVLDTQLKSLEDRLGSATVAEGSTGSTSIGDGSGVTGDNSVSIGDGSGVTGDNSVAIGVDASTNESDTVAVGGGSSASGEGATSLGAGTSASGTGSTALGGNAYSSGDGSVALGNDSVAGTDGVVSVGHKAGDTDAQGNTYVTNEFRRIINVANGVDTNDATTVGQMNTAINVETSARTAADTALSDRIGTLAADGNYIKKSDTNNVSQNLTVLDTELKTLADRIGSSTVSDGSTGSTAMGDGSEVTGNNSVGVGDNSKVTGDDSVSVGTGSSVEGNDGVSVGNDSSVTGDGSVSIGSGTTVDGDNSVGIGKDSEVTGNDGIALGNEASSTEAGAISIGSGSSASGVNATSLGTDAEASGNHSTALGDGANALGDSSVALGSNSVAGTADVISVGHKAGDTDANGNTYTTNEFRRIINVANGIDDNDAATVGQVNSAVSAETTARTSADVALSDRIGTLLNDGNYIKKSETNNVSQNLTALDTQMKTNVDRIMELESRIGTATVTDGSTGSSAVGDGSSVTGDDSVAVGDGSSVSGNDSVSVGNGSSVDGDSSVSVGKDAIVTGDHSLGLGGSASVEGNNSVGIGDGSEVTGNNSVALGTNASSTEDNAVSIGSDSTASGDGAVSLGTGASATNTNSVALGNNAHSSADNSVALGSNSVADTENVISVGHKAGDTDANGNTYTTNEFRRIINIANGIEANDAATVGQMNTALDDRIGTISADGNYIKKSDTNNVSQNLTVLDTELKSVVDRIGSSTVSAGSTGSTAMGDGSEVTGNNSVGVGDNSKVTGDDSVSVGTGSSVEGNDGVSVGNDSTVTGNNSVGIGSNATVDGDNSVGIGKDSEVTANNGIALGSEASSTEAGAIAIGSGSSASGVNATSLGTDAEASGNHSTALGDGANAFGDSSISLGSNSVAGTDGVVSVGHKAGDLDVTGNTYTTNEFRRIINVANGVDDNDAVTVGQMNQQLATINNYNTTLDARIGTIVSDGNYIRSSATNDVAANLMALDTQLKATDVSSLKYDGVDHSLVTMGGTNGTVLRNVKSGVVNETSMDAVNGSQLYAVKQDITGFASDIQANATNIDALNSSVTAALSSVSASGVLVDTLDSSKADKSLSNLSDAGKRVLKSYAEDAVATYLAEQGLVTPAAPMAVNTANSNTLIVTNAGNGSLHVGEGSYVNGTSSIAIGVGNQVNANNSGAFGDPSIINADASYVLGNDDTINAGATGSFIVGNDGVSDAKGGLLFGSNTKATIDAEDGMALGNRSEVSAKNAIALGSGSIADTENTLSIGNSELKRKIVNVADGDISQNSSEAITGAQLYITNENVKKNAEALEMKANVDASNINTSDWVSKLGIGKVEDGNADLVTGGTVYDAIQSVKGNELVQTNGEAITIGANSTASVIDVSDVNGQGRAITGIVTDVNDASSAANVGYVNQVSENIVKATNSAFQRVDNKINKVGANAAAIANLPTPTFDGDEKWAFAAGVGRYQGETAGAVGAFYKPTDNVIARVSGSFGNGDEMIGAGVAVSLNKGNTPAVSKAQLVRTINAQAEKINNMEASHKAEINAVRGENAELRVMVLNMQQQLNAMQNSK